MSEKIRLTKKKAKQGLDNIEFELALTGRDMKDLQKQSLINAQGFKYGSVEAKNGKALIQINLPKFVCGNNIEPYSIFESVSLDMIRNDCIEQLGRLFNNCSNTQVNKIEVNITQQVSGNATVNDVLNVLCHATLSSEFDNVKYVGKNKQDLESFKEESHSVITRKPHYWVCKCYNKSEQITKERIKYNLPLDDIPQDLLRIEFVLVERTLKKLFKDKRTLSDVLLAKNIVEIFREYKRLFWNEIIEKSIKPYLKYCTQKLFETMIEMGSPIEVIARERELIPDARVLQRALKKYMKWKGVTNNSARDTRRYVKKFNLPVDCIMTITEFKKSCG